MEFLASIQGTQGAPQTDIWPRELTFFLLDIWTVQLKLN